MSLVVISLIFVAILLGGFSVLTSLKKLNFYSKPVAVLEPRIEILIPCHNEEKKIGITLKAILLQSEALSIRPKVRVALDSCTDQTEAEVMRFKDLLDLTVNTVQNRSKWRTLEGLANEVAADRDWVILMDAGVDLGPSLLLSLSTQMKDPTLSYIAPAYRIEGGSHLSQAFWKFESQLKQFENRAGGPLSIHGATVAYRREVIQTVFQKLKKQTQGFKNDDIILPIASRLYFKNLRGLYLSSLQVFDHAVHDHFDFATQVNQRKRMVIGNLEWMRWLMQQPRVPMNLKILALRRAFRPFWAYFLIMLGLSLASLIGVTAWMVLTPLVVFRAAALASFYSLYAFLLKKDQQQTAWK